MPMSTWNNTEKAAEFIRRVKPETVLDIGVGFGKWGFLIRGSSETICQRMTPEEWKIDLEGIEGETRYVDAWSPMLHFLYNRIYVMDVRNFEFRKQYDMVIAGDVLEHLELDESIELIEDILDNTQLFIFAIPIGESWLHTNDGYAKNYPLEKHRCVWNHEDLFPSTADYPRGIRVAPDGTLWLPKPSFNVQIQMDARFEKISQLRWKPNPLPDNIYEGIQKRLANFKVDTHTALTKTRTINLYLGERK